MKIDHIGIATRGIEESLGFWRDALGLEVKHTETVEEQGVRVAMLPVGEPRVELLEPTGPTRRSPNFLRSADPASTMSPSASQTSARRSRDLNPRARG